MTNKKIVLLDITERILKIIMATIFQTMDVSNEMYNLLKWLKNNVSNDKTKGSWNGIHIKNNGTSFEATDGYKLVVAKLNQPLHDNLTDGVWELVTITKKFVALVKIDDVIFPDTSVILTDYDKPITDSQSFITIQLSFLISVINGFEQCDINFVTNKRPIQIVLRSNNMPIGTYVAVVMPLRSDYNFKTIQSDIKFVKEVNNG